MEPVEPNKMDIYEMNTYRKDLTWLLHFEDKSRLQVRQQVKDQESYIFDFVVCLTILSSIYDMATVFHGQPYGIETQSNLRRRKPSFSNRDRAISWLVILWVSSQKLQIPSNFYH